MKTESVPQHMSPDFDPHQRYGGLYQEITTYTDRRRRRVIVEPSEVHPFGKDVKIISPDEVGPETPSLFFCDVDGSFRVSGDEGVIESQDVRMVPFGPFQQVVIEPTVRGRRRTVSVTIRHAADLFAK